MTNYDHQKIEKKWQKFWLENKTFQASIPPDKGARGFDKKFYALDMFPYPSGAGLHVGHPLGMTATDIISRKKRHEGYNVLHPMGWDAFGLPAENYAIKTGVHPQKSTQENITNFRRQIQSLGFSYDWDREIDTTDPDYYKWSQWIFLQLYKKGLAYEEEKAMNWCPSCKIVAANEEVEQGTHERCGAKVERKKLKQWMFEITKYAERLLNDLNSPTVHIFHGWGADSQSNWFENSRDFLAKHQVNCQVLDFPNTEMPKYEEWKNHFEKSCKNVWSQDVMIGHSLGGGFIQKYLSENDVQVEELILVAPTIDNCGIDEIKNFFETDFDYEKIKNSAKKITIFGSENDHHIGLDKFKFLAKKLDAEFILLPNRGHIQDEDFPELREKLNEIQKSVLDWPDKIKAMQRNWIGKSEGAEVDFEVETTKNTPNTKKRGAKIPCGGCAKDNQQPSLFDTSIFSEIKEVKFKKARKLKISDIESVKGNISFFGKDLFQHWQNKSQSEKKFRSSYALTVLNSLDNLFYASKNVGYFISKNKVFCVVLQETNKRKSVKTYYQSKKLTKFYAKWIKNKKKITVYTTRPDTLFGATYFVLAPEHELVDKITTPEFREKITAYKKTCANKSELERTELNKEKTGQFTGAYVKNPVNGKSLPVWIADYVMTGYGTGAIMAVPAHDERDFEFAKKYDLEIIPVITPLVAKYTVIEKSLKNAEQVLKKFGLVKVLQTDKDWGKFFEVSVLHENEPKFREFLKENLLPEEISGAKSFYADSIRTSNYVIFKNKEFKIWTKQDCDKIKKYGTSLGIPEKQVQLRSVSFCDYNGILTNSEFLDGLPVEQAIEKMTNFLTEKKLGKKKTNYKLRDWIFTRQRYWGEPIPLVFDEAGKCYPLADSELPLKLPETPNYQPSNDGQSPLAKITDWVNVQGDITQEGTVKISPTGKTKFSRETSTMPNWAGSSWYWLRYMDPQNSAKFCDKEIENYWGPVDLYVGGAEHAVLHLLYSRFWHKVLYDLDLVSTKEPFKKLVNQGLIMGEDGNKMSKSLGNVVNPDEIVEKYGADTFRMYEMFMGPFEQSKPWASSAVGGMRRFLDRVWRVAQKPIFDLDTADGLCKIHGPELHKTVKIVGEHIDEFKFNTAISQMMVLINMLTPLDKIPREMLRRFTIVLSPFAPHLAEEIWREKLGEKDSISAEPWPEFDEEALVEDLVTYAVQINGKVRGDFQIDKNTSKDKAISTAKGIPKVAKYLAEGEIKKEIFVPSKIIGFVVS